MRRLLVAAFVGLIPLAAAAETIDGIAATVDEIVITISDLDRLAALQIVPQKPLESDDSYRQRILQHLIERVLQRRDIRRFSTIEVDPGVLEEKMSELVERLGSKEEYERMLQMVGLRDADVRELLSAEIEVRTYIDERFAPLLFVPLDEIERYYDGPWSQQRREQGLEVPPLADVRESLRDQLRAEQLSSEVDRWTRQLRSRANVDMFVYR